MAENITPQHILVLETRLLRYTLSAPTVLDAIAILKTGRPDIVYQAHDYTEVEVKAWNVVGEDTNHADT